VSLCVDELISDAVLLQRMTGHVQVSRTPAMMSRPRAGWPASEKRQGTKSRREVVRRQCRKLYGVLVTGESWRPDDLPRAIRVERGYNLNVTARILLNGEFTFCPIHDFNELRVARERDRQLVRDELPDNLWLSDSIERLIRKSRQAELDCF